MNINSSSDNGWQRSRKRKMKTKTEKRKQNSEKKTVKLIIIQGKERNRKSRCSSKPRLAEESGIDRAISC